MKVGILSFAGAWVTGALGLALAAIMLSSTVLLKSLKILILGCNTNNEGLWSGLL